MVAGVYRSVAGLPAGSVGGLVLLALALLPDGVGFLPLVEVGQAIATIDKSTLLLQRAEQEVLLERAEINIRQLNSQLRRQREL